MTTQRDNESNPRSWWDDQRTRFGWSGPSGFGSSTSAEAVADRFVDIARGKTVLITGCTNGGLGFETARVFAKSGAKVIVHCRKEEAAEAAIALIKTEFPSADIISLLFDLGSLKSVGTVGKLYNEKVGKKVPLHILINNAGIMACPFATTVDGIESQFGVNHIGHFALFKVLLDKLRLGAKDGYCRVVSLSSLGHRRLIGFDIDTLYDPKHFNSEEGYDAWNAYGRAKLANVLFALQVEKKYGSEGIHAMSLHPGMIITNLGKHVWKGLSVAESSWLFRSFVTTVMNLKSIPQGASTSVYCALAPDVADNYGQYFEDCNLSNQHLWGKDENLAVDLWKISEKLVKKI